MYTTMAALDHHPTTEGDHDHSHHTNVISDTTSASPEVAAGPLSPCPGPLSLGPLQETSDQTDFFPELLNSFPELPQLPKQRQQRPLPSPRAARSLSLAQISGPIKRKPLSATASPLATRYSSPRFPDVDFQDLARPEHRFARSVSLDSPTLYEFPSQSNIAASSSLRAVEWPESPRSSQLSSPASERFLQPTAPAPAAEDVRLRNIVESNPAASQTPHTLEEQRESLSAETASVTSQDSDYSHFEFAHLYSPEPEAEPEDQRTTVINTNNKTMSFMSRKSPPPHLNLGSPVDKEVQDTPFTASIDSSNLNKPLPKSPASSKLGVFFGWAATPSPSHSSVTEFSDDRGYSPLPSPSSFKQETTGTDAYDTPISAKSTTYANDSAPSPALHYCESYLQTPKEITRENNSSRNSTASLVEIEEMEDELKAISAELAASIRREMDLEDLVDRMQEQVNNPQAPGKRSSDYFSDSGYSSARFSEYDHAKEEVSQIQRRSEQEKAQLRLELTTKLQEERSMRRTLDLQIQELQQRASEVDVAQFDNSEASNRIKELETMCEDLTRRLSEEKEVKNNFEDLLTALKGELQTAANERDNLRDEIVPQLRLRVEGLEAEAAENAKLAYDTSKMQQELESLRTQNADISNLQQELDVLRSQNADTSKLQHELETLRAQTVDTSSLQEELDFLRSQNADTSKLQQELDSLRSQNAELKQTGTRMSMALSRSASVTGGSYNKKGSRPASLARSNSTRPPVANNEPREVLAERLKDVEAQRDALHSALRSLLERQEHQNRENDKRIKQLEMERDRLLSASPKKAGYEREVSNLREEINVLRRRAEEAIEQRWQVEKGLGGLKMDLDRAVEEIAMLRSLLQENDILIPESLARSSGSHDSPVTSASLEKAYKDLQAAYTEALERIKTLEESTNSDERLQLAIQRLEQSLSTAISDRDIARSEADSYRTQFESMQATEKQHFDLERDLAAQLQDSARRVEELAQQVRSQLDANSMLRSRLATTIARGEAEQRLSTERIAGLQSRLRALEEQVIHAQTGAEERVARHEEELAMLKEAHSIQLHRLRDASGGLRSPRHFPSKSPLSPMFTMKTATMTRSPRMSSPLLSPYFAGSGIRRSVTTPLDGGANSMAEQVETLKGRVAELEGALASADSEMQEVVGRMNTAQIEVMSLQEEREQAVRETRKLQRLIEQEKMRVFEERFRALSTEVRS
ncbi:hypothetical protein QBC35DRAFT_511685 [Podospora australis]|uniref:Protein phosphatase 1 regulatory subunit 21 N-terminal domain-containing protein n=1 Tax=Podospora australis TaxID=1536484 RepID=A0AAN6X2U7_9PEZI|nr:hypothetical protein QBC35DRAFT_511685 [Podospora australis]